MAQIDALFVTRLKLTGAPTVTGQVPVWNNGTLQWVPGTVAAGPGAPVTALPGSPTDTQQVIFTDSTTAPTFAWLLQWSTAASKWFFVGGSPITAEVATSETTASATYAALATAGPSVTLSRAGTYVVSHGFSGFSSNQNAMMSYDIGGTGAVDADWVIQANLSGSPARTQVKSGITAATSLVSKYRASLAGGTQTYEKRWISAYPVFVT